MGKIEELPDWPLFDTEIASENSNKWKTIPYAIF